MVDTGAQITGWITRIPKLRTKVFFSGHFLFGLSLKPIPARNVAILTSRAAPMFSASVFFRIFLNHEPSYLAPISGNMAAIFWRALI